MMALAYQMFSISKINSRFPLLSSSILVSIGLEQQRESFNSDCSNFLITKLVSVG